MTQSESDSRTVDVPDGWIEREPERFEDRLFVTEETFDGPYDGLVAVQHIAIYDESGSTVVEYGDHGDVTFIEQNTIKAAIQTAESLMSGDSDD